MKLYTFDELEWHDCYEFCYEYDEERPIHWNKDSLYLSDEDMNELEPYLNQVFEHFSYYGPQKVTIEQWLKVKKLCLSDKPHLDGFFYDIKIWLDEKPLKSDYFWILGI